MNKKALIGIGIGAECAVSGASLGDQVVANKSVSNEPCISITNAFVDEDEIRFSLRNTGCTYTTSAQTITINYIIFKVA